MKKLLILALLLAGCASKPTKILVKNCDSLGSDLYRCEEIPTKEIRETRR